jgi:SOS-response transcriptional repressor LexA
VNIMNLKMCPHCGIRPTYGASCMECLRAKNHDDQHDAVLRLVDVVNEYQRRNRRPPSVRELMVLIGVRSQSTVQVRVDRAVKLGLLERDPHSARSLRMPVAMVAEW